MVQGKTAVSIGQMEITEVELTGVYKADSTITMREVFDKGHVVFQDIRKNIIMLQCINFKI